MRAAEGPQKGLRGLGGLGSPLVHKQSPRKGLGDLGRFSLGLMVLLDFGSFGPFSYDSDCSPRFSHVPGRSGGRANERANPPRAQASDLCCTSRGELSQGGPERHRAGQLRAKTCDCREYDRFPSTSRRNDGPRWENFVNLQGLGRFARR